MYLSIDFETRSTVDLTKTGVYRYAEDPTTDILCMAYAAWDNETPVDTLPIELWLPGDPVPPAIYQALNGPGVQFRAWNAQFERVMWRILVERYGFPEVPLDRWWCTEAAAYAMNLPGSLAMAGKVLNLKHQKDEKGHQIMLQLCKPRRPRTAQGESKDGVYWWSKTEEPGRSKYERLYSYCRQDVRVEIEAAQTIRPLTHTERYVYVLDQKINDRGVALDLDLVAALRDLTDEAIARANAELAELTGGEVTKVTQRARLQAWLNENGELQLGNLRKGTLEDALEDDSLSARQQRGIELRLEAGKASIKKLKTMELCVCADGRARGLLQYHAAGTGRWGGRLIQPQNMARPTVDDPERFIPLVMARDYDGIEAEAPVMEVAVSLLRSCFMAGPGNRFICSDYSSIEGHVVAWLAGQDEMMSYYEMAAHIHEYVTGERVDPESIEKGTEEYMVGKTAVLGCGFGMGGERFQTTVKDWTGLEIDRELADAAVYEIWRKRNPEIVDLWYELENAVRRAIRHPGEIVPAGRGGCLRYVVRGDFLYCVLPSGRPLAYALPAIELDEQGRQRIVCSSPNVYYQKADGSWGIKRWGRRSLYGGLLTENAVQALARDIMVAGMIRAEWAGYPIVLTVHDEILSEVPMDYGSLEEFEGEMTKKAEWALTVPVDVGGWVGQRYRKD